MRHRKVRVSKAPVPTLAYGGKKSFANTALEILSKSTAKSVKQEGSGVIASLHTHLLRKIFML